MSKFSSFLRHLLPALALLAAPFFQHSLAAQNLQVERLPNEINGVAFRGNELWQATRPTLVKRNLSTGEVEATFDAPGGISINASWGTDGFQSIAIDPKGDIWLALGSSGVARFDGTDQWKIWSPQSTPAFPMGMAFTQIGVEAATGRVWVLASNQNDIRYFTFDGSTWKEDVTLRGRNFNRFANGPQGEFVFCSRDTLLLRKNDTWVGIPEPEEGKYNYPEHPVFDDQGRLWLMAKLSKVYRYDQLDALPKLVTSVNANLSIFDMAFDGAGNLCIATYDSGLGRWNGSTWAYLPSLAGTSQKEIMWKLHKDPLGRLWINQWLDYYTPALTLWADGSAQRNFYYGIPQADRMSRDGEGNVWFGSSSPLLIRKNLGDGSLDYFEMFDWLGGNPGDSNYKLEPGAGDDIWSLTSAQKFLHFDGSNWSQFDSPELPKYLADYCVDSKGRLYVAGHSPPDYKPELKWHDPASNTWTKVDFSIFGNWESSFGDLAVDEADNLWFTSDEGLGKRNLSDGSLEIYPLPGGGSGWSSDVPEIQTGPGGLVYVVDGGEFFGGPTRLLQFNALTATWKEIPWAIVPNNESSDNLIWHVDPQGRVWAAMNFGFTEPRISQYWYWDDGFWTKIEGLPAGANDLCSDGKGNVYIGYHNFLAQFKTAGRIEGTLRRDTEQGCQPSADDRPIPNFVVVATDGKNQYLGLSRADGTYRVYSGSEKVTVRAVPANSLWLDCAGPGGQTLTLNSEQPTQLDFLLHAEQECPRLNVEISTPFLRRCFDNTYTVRACNSGTAAAEDAYVDISLPAEMEMQSANKPYAQVGPQQYRFPVGDLDIGACAVFQFVAHVKCDGTTIGQTLCVLAHVYPDTFCIQTASAWKGASMLLTARCEGDSVRFSLKNSGTAATSQPVDYQLLRNDALYRKGSTSLQPGQVHGIAAPADGATWRLEANQEPGHPASPLRPSLPVEACAAAPGTFDRGHVNSRPNSSGSAFEDIDCQELIGSYDPNDKAASPVGVGENSHFVLPGTELQYHIRFQNTGTDTAFTVVVRDTLSTSLDLSTFRPGASSHTYRFEARGQALAFTFDNILLPDSNANLAGSQGFVQFSIRPRRDVPLGTLLTNSAGIYFDFNPPVLTNTVWHIVDSSFQQTVSVGPDPQTTARGLHLDVFPNPAAGSFWVKIPQAESGLLEVYDAQGRLQKTLTVSDTSVPVQVDAAQLSAGLYILRFVEKNRASSATGKVVLRGH